MPATSTVASQLKKAAMSEPDIEFAIEEVGESKSKYYVLSHEHPGLGPVKVYFSFRAGQLMLIYRFGEADLQASMSPEWKRGALKSTIVKQLSGTLRRPIKVLTENFDRVSDHLRDLVSQADTQRSRVGKLAGLIGKVHVRGES